MEIKSDIICRGNTWFKVGHGYGYNEKQIFFKTFWSSFKLCMAIGILNDQQLDDEPNNDEDDKKMTIPRIILHNNSSVLHLFFQAAILTSNCVTFSEKDRLYLAFSEDVSEDDMNEEDFELLKVGVSKEALEFDRIGFLKKFANYGATKMEECLSDNEVDTMNNLASFLVDSYKGETKELEELFYVEDIFDDI